ATAKAAELERRQRGRVDASRPPSRIEELRRQAQQTSTVPRLDPRVRVPALKFTGTAVRDILSTIAAASSPPINITYQAGQEALLGRPYSIEVQDLSLEDALNQVLTNNQLAFKVVNSKTIFVFADTAQNHGQYDDL